MTGATATLGTGVAGLLLATLAIALPAPTPALHMRRASHSAPRLAATAAATPAPAVDSLPVRPVRHLPPSEPDQLPVAAQQGPVAAPFLTRPYAGPHAFTSGFDHCNPDYSQDGVICRYDGAVASAEGGADPYFGLAYPLTPGGDDYLYYDGHDGWDVAMNEEPVLAAAPGTVTLAGPDEASPDYGNAVVIDHHNGFTTLYGHLDQVQVGAGQQVARGQQIAISGSTGNVSGPHLHFGVYRSDGGSAIDPFGWGGTAADPWSADAGDLWLSGVPQDPIALPPTVRSLSAGDGEVSVSWTAPAFDGGSPVTSYLVLDAAGRQLFQAPGRWTSAVFHVRDLCAAGSLQLVAVTAQGQGYASAPSAPVCPAPAPPAATG